MKSYNIIIVIIVIIIVVILALFFHIFMKNNIESFSNYLNTNKSHTVNLPINTTVSCKNFCNPQNICALTGDQCSDDVDCCPALENKYNSKNIYNDEKRKEKTDIIFNISESILTTDIGTNAKSIDSKNDLPINLYNGPNLWEESANVGMELYDKRYNPPIEFLSSVPHYPFITTLTGEFLSNFPPASNIHIY
jgi:hypothetical protein